MAVFHLFLALLALMAAGKADEEVHKQSFKREQLGLSGQQVTRRLDRSALSLDKSVVGEVVFKRNSSEVIGRQGRASKSRPSRQSCTAKTGMSFTRCKQSNLKKDRDKYKYNIHGKKQRQYCTAMTGMSFIRYKQSEEKKSRQIQIQPTTYMVKNRNKDDRRSLIVDSKDQDVVYKVPNY